MRSRGLQLARPIWRPARYLCQSPSSLITTRCATTSAPRRATSARAAAGDNSSQTTTTATTRTPKPAAARRTPGWTSTGVKAAITEELSESQIDPQAAVPPAGTVSDVDPQLASSIPTPGTSPSSGAFAAALESGNTNGNGNADNNGGTATIDWSSSFHGLSTVPFPPEVAAVLLKEINPLDVEIKPDGIIYMPEIKYRRILNMAFGPGGWGLAPRGELVVGEKVVTREFALIVHGRFVAVARGECTFYSEETIPTAGEGCKSNALTRCCKDLGIASELWDPRFIREFKKTRCEEVWVEHVVSKKRRQIWKLKDADVAYPYQQVKR